MHIYVNICMDIYIYIYIYIYVYIYISKSDAHLQIRHRMCVSKDGTKIKSHHHLRECFSPLCVRKVKDCLIAICVLWHDSFICVTWLIHMCDMTHSYACHDSFISQRLPHCHMCTTPHSLHQRYLKFFSCPPICVCIILHTYIRPHTRRMNSSTHIMSDSLYAYKHTDPKKRTQSKERESKRDREEMWGGRFLEIGSGWWSGLHLQMLEACLPMGWLRLVGCLKIYMSLCRI